MGMYISGYSIEEYIKRCCELNLNDVIINTKEDLVRLSSMRPPHDSNKKEEFLIYRSFLRDFLDFLEGTPIGIIAEYNRPKIKPIIQHFVEKGQMPEKVLTLFE